MSVRHSVIEMHLHAPGSELQVRRIGPLKRSPFIDTNLPSSESGARPGFLKINMLRMLEIIPLTNPRG